MTHLGIAIKSDSRLHAGMRTIISDAAIEKTLQVTRVAFDAAAFVAAYLVAFDVSPDGVITAGGVLWLAASAVTGLLCLAMAHAYARRRPLLEYVFDTVAVPFKGAFAAAVTFVTARWISGGAISAHSAFVYASGTMLLVMAERVALQLAVSAARYGGWGRRGILIAGPTSAVQQFANELRPLLAPGFGVAGTFAVDAHRSRFSIEALKSICAGMADAAVRLEANEILVVDPGLEPAEISAIVGELKHTAAVRVASRRLRTLAAKTDLPRDVCGDAAIVEFGARQTSRVERFLKRGFDYFFSIVAVAVLAPVWITAALVILVVQGRPVLFRQIRITRGGTRFTFYKFRTMVNGAHRRMRDAEISGLNTVKGPMFKCPADPRVTRVGRYLRRFSLDEIPQFFNVLKGDISVVGVRPPLPEETHCYEGWQRTRLSGWMGITGLWQVSGRSDLDFDDVVLLDLFYNSNFSFAMDLRIIWKTLGAVLSGKGAY